MYYTTQVEYRYPYESPSFLVRKEGPNPSLEVTYVFANMYTLFPPGDNFF
jgi:hypothetical protein